MRAFFPRATSPWSIAGPSAMTSPFSTLWPTVTMGLWLLQVAWFERIYLMISYSLSLPPSSSTLILSAQTFVTTPPFSARTQTPESTAALYSIPVPTMGASVVRRGTACFCMFEPMSARFASSFSRNGIIAVATETTIAGETSI